MTGRPRRSLTERQAMEIVWVELEPGYRPNGHLVGFYDTERGQSGEECLIAFIEGYAWLFKNDDEARHSDKPKQITIYCIKADAVTTQRTLDVFKQMIEDCIRNTKDVPFGYLGRSRRLKVIPDC